MCHERSVTDGFLTDIDTELTALLAAERTARNDKVLAAPVPFGPVSRVISETQILIFLYRQFHMKGIAAVQGLKFKNAS